METKKKPLFLMLSVLFLLTLIPEGMKFHNVKVVDIITLLSILFIIAFKIKNIQFNNDTKLHIKNVLLDRVNLSILALTIVMLLSVSYSVDKHLALQETVRFVSYGVIYLILSSEIEEKTLKAALKVFSCAVLILGLYGVIQFLTGFGVEKAYIAKYSYGVNVRIDGTFGNPDSYGGFLILVAFPIISLLLNAKKKGERIFYFIISVLIVLNVYFTGSRNAYLGLLLGLLILVLYNKRKYILAFVGFTGVMLIIPVVRNRLLQVFDSSQNVARIKIWKVAIKMINDHPVFGVGNGNFYTLYNKYIRKYPDLMYEAHQYYTSHNSFLKIQSELGILGSIIFLLIMILSIISIYKISKSEKSKYLNSYFAGYFASIVSFYFMNLFDNLFFVPKVTIYFWIMLALSQGILLKRNGKHLEE